jgi:hypothetical protein
VYLADVGANGLYGYCTTDDPSAFDPNYPYFDVSAFCVVDNDMSPSQFQGGANRVPALQVTLAHKFIHAVQAAYDWFEDAWFMEGNRRVDRGLGLRQRQRQSPVPREVPTQPAIRAARSQRHPVSQMCPVQGSGTQCPLTREGIALLPLRTTLSFCASPLRWWSNRTTRTTLRRSGIDPIEQMTGARGRPGAPGRSNRALRVGRGSLSGSERREPAV